MAAPHLPVLRQIPGLLDHPRLSLALRADRFLDLDAGVGEEKWEQPGLAAAFIWKHRVRLLVLDLI
jgi:hypothetical protein